MMSSRRREGPVAINNIIESDQMAHGPISGMKIDGMYTLQMPFTFLGWCVGLARN